MGAQAALLARRVDGSRESSAVQFPIDALVYAVQFSIDVLAYAVQFSIDVLVYAMKCSLHIFSSHFGSSHLALSALAGPQLPPCSVAVAAAEAPPFFFSLLRLLFKKHPVLSCSA